MAATNASNAFEDLSGVSTAAFNNPYDALIAAVEDDPVVLSQISFGSMLI